MEQDAGNPPINDTTTTVAAVDQTLSTFLNHADLATQLDAAVRYALLGPGKRIRPRLCLAAFDATGGSRDHRPTALAAAGAVEMVHAFSLVHDDLPALDNDELRRGRPTTHVQFGEPLAVLAGDGLLALAFQLIADTSNDPATTARLTRELAAGTVAMVNGQVLDTLGTSPDNSPPPTDPLAALRRIHRDKTGALIRAACRMGTIAAAHDDDSEALTTITRYADSIGLMFQIVDDLLDVEGDPSEVGKATRKDADAGKLTYPGVLGIDESRAEIERLERDALDAAATFGDHGQALVDLCHELRRRRH